MAQTMTAGAGPVAAYKCGSLSYTKRGLVTLFLWLLWGDFCFVCMEMVHPTVLPLMLKGLGASNVIISIYVTTIVSAMNAVINPVVSFTSDRYRSRFGRRRPFLLLATPFVSLFLALNGLAKPISKFITSTVAGGAISEATVAIVFIGVVVVGYQFFHMIVGSVYYYLFNDVVPEQFLGRFLALFRAVGTGAGALYQFFAYKYAVSHGSWIFLIVSVVYLIGFMGMALMVKEGDYPPPPENIDGNSGLLPSLKTFFSECFVTNPFYWRFYAVDACVNMSVAANIFVVFWFTSMGMTLGSYGKIMGISQIVSTLLLIPAGMLSDKKHPIRIILLGMMIMTLTTPIGFVFFHGGFSRETIIWLMIAYTVIQIPGGVIYQASALPLFMRLLPRERYGQFSSANAMIRSIAMIGAGALVGVVFDRLKVLYPDNDYYYRFVPVWVFAFQIVATIAIARLYRAWQRLGGDEGYVPPPVGRSVETVDQAAEEAV